MSGVSTSDNISFNNSAPVESEVHRKVFVGGLAWETTEESLKAYFDGLGMEVERAMVMKDKYTGRSRGFGFIILKEKKDVDKAVTVPLLLEGRKIEAKRAVPKEDMEHPSHKLFVGGLPVSLTKPDFRQYFAQFGPLADAQIMTERESGRSRGFGFVTYKDDASVEKVLATTHTIQGKPVEVKRAEPKKPERPPGPIIVPVPYFPPNYPLSDGNSPPAAGNVFSLGQTLAYDPSGYFIAQPFYPGADGQPVIGSSASPFTSSLVFPPPPPPSQDDSYDASNPDLDNELSTAEQRIPVDRVKIAQNEVRKKRGMSSPYSAAAAAATKDTNNDTNNNNSTNNASNKSRNTKQQPTSATESTGSSGRRSVAFTSPPVGPSSSNSSSSSASNNWRVRPNVPGKGSASSSTSSSTSSSSSSSRPPPQSPSSPSSSTNSSSTSSSFRTSATKTNPSSSAASSSSSSSANATPTTAKKKEHKYFQ